MTFRTSDPLATDDETTRVTIGAQQLARLRRIEQAATRVVELLEATSEQAARTQHDVAPPPVHSRSTEIAARKALVVAVRS